MRPNNPAHLFEHPASGSSFSPSEVARRLREVREEQRVWPEAMPPPAGLIFYLHTIYDEGCPDCGYCGPMPCPGPHGAD